MLIKGVKIVQINGKKTWWGFATFFKLSKNTQNFISASYYFNFFENVAQEGHGRGADLKIIV